MTAIKMSTKRGQNLMATAERYNGFYLDDVYNSYSLAKANAWKSCYDMFKAEKGMNFHICSHNSNVFTVAWVTAQGIRIETARNSFLIIFE